MLQPSILGIISYKVFPAQMGGQKYIVDYYRELSKHTKVILAVSTENQVSKHLPVDNQLNTIPILFNHWYGIFNLFLCFKLARLIRKEKIDIIMIDHSYFGWLGVLLRTLTHKKLVIRSANIETIRFKDMGRWSWRIYNYYEQWVHKQADRNFFITDEERKLAILRWGINPTISFTLTYGTHINTPTTLETHIQCRKQILQENQLKGNTKLFLFNGTLDYLPNQDALYIIVNELMHRLHSARISFKIIVCGNRIKQDWEKLLTSYEDIIFKGLVNDIGLYYKGADCFICPVTLGTGIKTKLVEAVAYGQKVICCNRSAAGLSSLSLDSLITVIADYDWDAFATAMIELNPNQHPITPDSFYKHFNWQTIVHESILSLPK
jgi:hypothetical protein